MPLQVLIVDDDPAVRSSLAQALAALGCRLAEAVDAAQAIEQNTARRFDLVLVDTRLAGGDGLPLVARLMEARPELAVIAMGAGATVATAVRAMKLGAREFLERPATDAQVQRVVEQALERRVLLHRVKNLEGQLKDAVPAVDLESRAPEMRVAIETVQRAAGSDVSVLLRGESGTGKGVLARLLHARSARASRPFVTVSCPTLSSELLASEMFGHARGAFTGAVRDQPGRVEAADGGTLFLDEVGDVSPALQAKLLRFLQDHEFERVGESRTRCADVRVVAATNRDLEADVAGGRFREDLLYRLNVVEVTLPPLRARPADILPLAREFVAFFARSVRRPPPVLSPEAEHALTAYAWPGNVRELRNVIEHAVMLWPDPVIDPRAFPERVNVGGAAPGAAVALGGDATLEAVEREHMARVLARAASLDEAARILGINPSTLWRRRRKYGL